AHRSAGAKDARDNLARDSMGSGPAVRVFCGNWSFVENRIKRIPAHRKTIELAAQLPKAATKGFMR
ncbi:hypothetical protein KQH27_00750, partial [bacterium]|nr:hypothetical protein [bacterium]